MNGAVTPPRARHIVLLGPPGAGKGTQAGTLAKELGYAHLSTGDLLRSEVAAGTPLGRAADGYMRAGQLVPDELVLEILRGRLRRPDAEAGFLLDGFPRTLAQAAEIERWTPIELVISFEIERTQLIARLAGRRICPRCGAVYHLDAHPPREPGRCDRDGTELVQRPDDRPEAIEVRLRVYAEATEPLLGFYRDRGVLRGLDASGSPAEVAVRFRRLVEPGGTP